MPPVDIDLALLRQSIREAISGASRAVPQIKMRNGTVASASTDRTAFVVVDGDVATTAVINATGSALAVDDRVAVAFIPPQGVIALGVIGPSAAARMHSQVFSWSRAAGFTTSGSTTEIFDETIPAQPHPYVIAAGLNLSGVFLGGSDVFISTILANDGTTGLTTIGSSRVRGAGVNSRGNLGIPVTAPYPVASNTACVVRSEITRAISELGNFQTEGTARLNVRTIPVAT